MISQQQGEAAGDFGLRVQKLHNRLLTIYDSAPDLEPADGSLFKRTTDRDALQQFLFDLSHPLDYQVRSERPSSLSQAIRLAIDFECRQNARWSTALINHAAPLSTQPFLPQSGQSLQQIQPTQPLQQLQQAPLTQLLPLALPTPPLQQMQQITSMQQGQQILPIEQLLQAMAPQIPYAVPQQVQPLAPSATLTPSSVQVPQDTAHILRALVETLQTKSCTGCGHTGHTVYTCRNISCEYCGIRGHGISICRNLRDDLRSG